MSLGRFACSLYVRSRLHLNLGLTWVPFVCVTGLNKHTRALYRFANSLGNCVFPFIIYFLLRLSLKFFVLFVSELPRTHEVQITPPGVRNVATSRSGVPPSPNMPPTYVQVGIRREKARVFTETDVNYDWNHRRSSIISNLPTCLLTSSFNQRFLSMNSYLSFRCLQISYNPILSIVL